MHVVESRYQQKRNIEIGCVCSKATSSKNISFCVIWDSLFWHSMRTNQLCFFLSSLGIHAHSFQSDLTMKYFVSVCAFKTSFYCCYCSRLKRPINTCKWREFEARVAIHQKRPNSCFSGFIFLQLVEIVSLPFGQ